MASFNDTAASEGWTPSTQVEVLLDFIRFIGQGDELATFAGYVAAQPSEPRVIAVEIDRTEPRRFPGRDEGVESVPVR